MTIKTIFDPDKTSRAIIEALPRELSAHGEPPEPRNLYVPPRHTQALSPDHGLVVGIRGAGKSVWWAALQSEYHRRVVADALPNLALDEVSVVDAGFGEENRPNDYPDKRVLRPLLKKGRTPADLWRTVVAWHTWGKPRQGNGSELGRLGSWREKVAWIEEHPEEVARDFKAYDDKMKADGRKHLVLFDALDRSADDWEGLRQLLRGLLEVLLEFRSYRAIRAKAFVRPDMLDDPAVTAFRDASKITAGKVELRWSRADLYGLLFQHLGNAPTGGAGIRSDCEEFESGRWVETRGIWQVPKLLRENEEYQREVFHAIAGPWMGRDRRRGLPYTWLPNHLADAAEQVSPRSFLAAVRTAAEDPGDRRDYALHYEGIKKGVREASRIRVAEVKEDFFWVPTLMEPLHGLVIPCDYSEILKRWKGRNVLKRLREEADRNDALLPKHIDEGHKGLRDDLLDLGLFYRQRDGRINMPDVYRVGFGLGRRGGVKPIR